VGEVEDVERTNYKVCQYGLARTITKLLQNIKQEVWRVIIANACDRQDKTPSKLICPSIFLYKTTPWSLYMRVVVLQMQDDRH